MGGNCRKVLEDLQTVLKKYLELDTTARTFHDKSRKVWKKLKWDQEDVKELRARIISSSTMLNSFYGQLTR